MLGAECLWRVRGECLVCVILVCSICGVCFVNAWGFTNTNERDTLPPGLSCSVIIIRRQCCYCILARCYTALYFFSVAIQ